VNHQCLRVSRRLVIGALTLLDRSRLMRLYTQSPFKITVVAFVFRNTITFHKRQLGINVSTYEYLYGFATTNQCYFLMLGSQGLTAAFFDE